MKPGHRVSVLGLDDAAFLDALRARGANVSTRRRKGSDLIFFRAETVPDLVRIAGLEPYLERDGAIWVVRPKGVPHIKETDVIDAALAAGLVDNKIASFSDTLSAMRIVIRLKDR